jgi:hypothetical protein
MHWRIYLNRCFFTSGLYVSTPWLLPKSFQTQSESLDTYIVWWGVREIMIKNVLQTSLYFVQWRSRGNAKLEIVCHMRISSASIPGAGALLLQLLSGSGKPSCIHRPARKRSIHVGDKVMIVWADRPINYYPLPKQMYLFAVASWPGGWIFLLAWNASAGSRS